MSSIKDLKQNLKSLSCKITDSKKELKKYQKEHAGYDGGFFNEIRRLSWEFRHKHIAYCLLRGTPYEAIEQPAEDNKPDMVFIKGVQDEYAAKDVCPSASGSL